MFFLGSLWLLGLMLPKTARADGVVLSSSGGGVYDYGYLLSNEATVTFDENQTIIISGLSGVTGASVTGDLSGFMVENFASDSVTFVSEIEQAFSNFSGTPFAFGDLIVNSTVLNLGTVDWSAQTTGGTLNGTAQGPSAPVTAPEPTSVSLMLLGIGLVIAMRKRTSAGLSRAS
jgi:hypothetical protein